jgi:hypothetical protein
MDPRVLLQGTAEIGPANPEEFIELPSAEWENLLDVKLSISGMAAQPPTGSYSNSKSVNIWFDSKNITKEYQSWIIRDLGQRGAESTTAYRDAIATLRQYWKNNQNISPLIKLINDQEFAKVSSTTWVNHFLSLGDHTTGPAGSYHPFNFLFGRVPVTPFSFRSVFDPTSDARVPVLQKVRSRTLVISAADRLLTASTTKSDALSLIEPSRVKYSVELVYKDPFEEFVSGELENLSNLLSATGPIQTALARNASTLQTLKDELWQTSLKAQGIPSAIERLEKLIGEVRSDLKRA